MSEKWPEPPGPWSVLMIHECGQEVRSTEWFETQADADVWIDANFTEDGWSVVYIQERPN